jgi:CheY-like chemotaxis protein
MYNTLSKKHSYPEKIKMSAKTKQHEQFTLLITSDTGINQSSLKQGQQNIITADKLDDILFRITTTQFDLILLDLTVSDLSFITSIKDPDCINNKTPIIALINQTEDLVSAHPYSMGFNASLIKPFTEDQLIETLQTKSLALDYIQLILNKTKNNQRLALTIFEKLFEELPLQIVDIKEALDNRQYNLAHEITHKLNGSVSFCGFMDIQQPANALESGLLTKNFADLNQHFLILQQYTLNFTRHQKFIMAQLNDMLLP